MNTQRREVLVSFLLDINGKIITTLRDPSERSECLQTTTSLLLHTLPVGIMDVFEHIHCARYAIFRHETAQARKKFLAQYCHRTVETHKHLAAATALSTEDANSLLNRIAVSENSAILIRYSAAATMGSAPQASPQWWDALALDAVTDDFLAEALESASAGSPTGGAVGGAQRAAGSCWSIPGIALFGLTILRSLDTTTASLGTSGVPAVINAAKLTEALRPYALSLLRTPLATAEGLDLSARVLDGTSAGAGSRVGLSFILIYLCYINVCLCL
jgi:hypothetical protein